MTTKSAPDHRTENDPSITQAPPAGHAEDLAATIASIRNLEDQRFDAIINADFESFASLCHEQLVYTHSNGARDSLASYRSKVEAGVYDYHHISHPVDDIIVVGDVALVIGKMIADLTVNGDPTKLDNTSLSVWVRSGEDWKFLAYQPTPNRKV